MGVCCLVFDSNFGIGLEIIGFIFFLPQTRKIILALDFPYILYKGWKSELNYWEHSTPEKIKSNPQKKRKTKKEFMINSFKRKIIEILFDQDEWYQIRPGDRITIKPLGNELLRFSAIILIVIGLKLQWT